MIGRWSSKDVEQDLGEPRGFDDFELRLGDVMRGERATMGKSLLDVQRELRIKASYIAAIENCDPDAFDTPGFIAGYVRSYARYLDMDPDRAFAGFCAESGFSVAHGMSAEASVIKKPTREERLKRSDPGDIFVQPSLPFTPTSDSFLSRIEPSAIGSVAVLVALIGALGFGGWTVLKEVQRVQVAPVDQTPIVLSDLDPVEGALARAPEESEEVEAPGRGMRAPRMEALDRLYRPQALDVPVLVARDAPISTLDPRAVGVFATSASSGSSGGEGIATDVPSSADEAIRMALAAGDVPESSAVPGDNALPGENVPQVVETPAPGLRMVAAYPSWVRVRAADGTVIYEGIMNKGDTYEVPLTEEPPTLRTGESGALFFAMSDGCYGPVGARGSVTSNLVLDSTQLAAAYEAVDPNADTSLSRMFADLSGSVDAATLAALPCQSR